MSGRPGKPAVATCQVLDRVALGEEPGRRAVTPAGAHGRTVRVEVEPFGIPEQTGTVDPQVSRICLDLSLMVERFGYQAPS